MWFCRGITGDPDENVYVIQSGRVNVFITGTDGTAISLKCVKTGESVTSLLSFTDVLTVSLFSTLIKIQFDHDILLFMGIKKKSYRLFNL